jgi:ParB family chromosome partitioning protein
LSKRFGYTHEEISRKLGKARTSVTETISLANIPAEIRELCRRADITTKSMLLQVVRQPTDDEMRALVYKIGAAGLTRDQAREVRHGKPKKISNYTYEYDDPGHEWSLRIQFAKSDVDEMDIRRALADALDATIAKQ